MKLYLFGGAETDQGQAPILKQLIKNVLVRIKPPQVLHIPYARIEVPKGEENIWGEGWFKKEMKIDGIKLLDARNDSDLSIAKKPVIFMNGGPQRDNLYDKIVSNKQLYDLVVHADYIIGESAGAMITGEFRPTYQGEETVIKKGLGLLKDTIIEAHYTQRNNHQALRDEMKESGAKYGIGIDSLTGIEVDTKLYPGSYRVIGKGLVEMLRT